jgi:glycosyltransferase involved in cell wall biosynthesis
MSARSQRRDRFVVVPADEDEILARLHSETEWPRQDVVELARALDADLLSFSNLPGSPWFTRALALCLGRPVALAWLAFRRKGSLYFANAENIALPLALLLRARPKSKLVFIGHRLTAPYKTIPIRVSALHQQADALFCYCRTQERHAIEGLGFPEERVQRIQFQVDERFFTPGSVTGRGVVSVGIEMRDYTTLFAALAGTGVPVTVVASSPWSKHADQTRRLGLPPNVTVRRAVSSQELRGLYQNAAVVVVPLHNVDWPAGVSTLLEAQACGRPVVVSASEGIRDSLEPGSAVLVPCGDVAALRAAVLRLIADPDEASALSRRAREAVQNERTLDQWVARIAECCRGLETSDNQQGLDPGRTAPGDRRSDAAPPSSTRRQPTGRSVVALDGDQKRFNWRKGFSKIS